MLARRARLVWLDETEEVEVLWAGGSLARGWVVLARDERRGDIPVAMASLSDDSRAMSDGWIASGLQT
jgi:hypothetical protein